MKRILAITLLFVATTASAQKTKIWGDPHIIEKFAMEASKNPAYTKLRVDVDALGKTATPKNTNATAVKALFEKNSATLKNLYIKAGLEVPKTMSARRTTKIAYVVMQKNSLLKNLQFTSQSNTKTEAAPFDAAWIRKGGHSNDGGYPDSSASSYASGKITMETNSVSTCAQNPDWGKCKLGYYHHGYRQKFTVPSNPEIIAAEVKFEYSYLYTGWDTYGGITALDMVIRADNKLNGSSYNELPDASSGAESGGIPQDRWKKIATIYPPDSTNADFGEFHSNGESSFTIDGYVTPGTEFEVMIGMGYPSGTKQGINGCYHYAEFILKKITVNYFKTAN